MPAPAQSAASQDLSIKKREAVQAAGAGIVLLIAQYLQRKIDLVQGVF